MIIQWAHHMKTPVAVIDLELQKAAKLELPPAPRAVLASIAEENDRLQSLLQTLLNLVRLDDFAADFRAEKVDLLALVRRVINENRRAFIAHRATPKSKSPILMICPTGSFVSNQTPNGCSSSWSRSSGTR